MQEDYGESNSLTLRTWSSRKSQKCKKKLGNTYGSSYALQEKQAWGDPSKTYDFKSKLHVSWKLVNPQECVWKNLHRNIMRDHIAGKGDNSLHHYNLVHKFFLCLKP